MKGQEFTHLAMLVFFIHASLDGPIRPCILRSGKNNRKY